MKHAAVCCLVLEVALANSTTVAAQVLTSQYDNLRTGATLREKILTPRNVNANQHQPGPHRHLLLQPTDYLRDYAIEKGRLVLNKSSRMKFANPGATPSVSASNAENAVVWAVATRTWNGEEQRAVLYAFDATNIEQPIYTSEQHSTRNQAALATRFVIPVVVDGRVYIGARGEVRRERRTYGAQSAQSMVFCVPRPYARG